METVFRVGIDLGGTFIKYGAVSADGSILSRGKVKTPRGCGYEQTLNAIADAVRELSRAGSVQSVGIGAPGVIDGERGIVVVSGNLGWENKPLAGDLSALTGLPVSLANDANAAAYGEYLCGAGKNYRSLVMVTLGTGVGSGIVFDGKLFEGNCGAGAEIGHTVIRAGGRKCACGRHGCLEAYASATALISRTKSAMEKDKDSLMWKICEAENADGKTAFEAMRAGDRTAKRVVNAYLRDLSEGLADIANAFRPEAILLGGGLSAEGEYLTAPLQKLTDRLILGGGAYAPVKIAAAKLGNDAGLIGAALLGTKRED